MPKKQTDTTYKLESRLSVGDRLLADQLKERLESLGDGPFLALIGVDSEELEEAVKVWLSENSKPSVKLYCPASKYKYSDFIKSIHVLEKGCLYIICLFSDNITEPEKIASQLIFNRDYIPQNRLKIVFIMSHGLLRTVIEKAYDFYAVAAFTCFFDDLLHKTKADFTHGEKQPPELIDYEKAREELELHRRASPTRKGVLLKKLFRLAMAAQNVSHLEEALALYLEALPLAEEDRENMSAILGNIGLIYRAKGDLDEALQYLRQAQEIKKRIGLVDSGNSD